METSQGTHLVYVHAGTNPFEVITQSVKYVWRINLSVMIYLELMCACAKIW